MKIRYLIIVFILYLFSAPLSSIWATAATLKCTPANGTYPVGSEFTVDYTLDTRNFPVYGADIIASFTYGVIEATTAQSTPITTTTNWNTPITNTVDNSLGRIQLDYGNNQAEFNGVTNVGNITFKTIKEGQVQFDFVFFQQYDDTTPGVAKVWGKKDQVNITNILTDVNNCIYVIEGTSVTTAPTLPPDSTLPPITETAESSIPTELPRAGNLETTLILATLGVIFILAGAFIPAMIVLKG